MHRNLLRRIVCTLGLLMWTGSRGVATPPPVVIPVPIVAGTTHSLEPFGLEWLQIPSSRYQQVYAAAAFTRMLPSGGFITMIGFRSDEVAGTAFVASAPAVEIRMSITSRNPDELSPTFTENTGINDQIVFPRGVLRLGSLGPGDAGGTRIPLATPYFYDPAQGNLLIEVLDFAQTQPPSNPIQWIGPLDAEDNFLGAPDTVSRVYAHDVSATVGIADSVGLMTWFFTTPIPEPSAAELALFGATVLAAGRMGLKLKAAVGARKHPRRSDVAD